MRVTRRHVIYVQGYDPRGLAQYYRMFRTELRQFARLYGISSSIGRPKSAEDGETASWTIDTEGPGWATHTRYDFLRWEDLIKGDLTWPIWRTVALAELIYWRLVFNGTIARFWSAHWRFATFVSYPHLVLLTEALGSLGIALLCGKALVLQGLPGAVAVPAMAAIFVLGLWALLKFTEKRTFALYLMSDTIFTWQFAHRQRPDWDGRIDHFARHLVDVISGTDAEEVLIVGHSSGSFLGVEILARALALDPDLGRHGPRVTLLTLGGNLPIVGFHKTSGGFRDHLRKLAAEPSIDWIDCQSRKDVMNFHPFDPIAGHGIDVGSARRNPTIMPVRFRDIIRSENYNLFRWKFFRVHFQFVMANQRPHPYDFFMICCGPVPLRGRVTHPDAALIIATGDPSHREIAWQVIDFIDPATSVPATSGRQTG